MWPGRRSVWSPHINSIIIKTGTHEEHLLCQRAEIVTPLKASLRSVSCRGCGMLLVGVIFLQLRRCNSVKSSPCHRPDPAFLVYWAFSIVHGWLLARCRVIDIVCLARCLTFLKVTTHIKATWDETAGVRAAVRGSVAVFQAKSELINFKCDLRRRWSLTIHDQ